MIVGRKIHAAPANFQNEILITNLNEPVSIEFLPDSRMLVIGRLGTIWVSQPSSGYTQLDAGLFLQLSNISTNGENGMFTIALTLAFPKTDTITFFTQLNRLRFATECRALQPLAIQLIRQLKWLFGRISLTLA